MFSGLLDQYKKELGEFVSTVKEDTAHVLSTAAEKISQLNGEEEGKERTSNFVERVPPTYAKFLENGMDDHEKSAFNDFESSFDLQARQDVITTEEADKVKAELELYVPEKLSKEEFWCRYFYYQHIQRRARLLAGDQLHEEEDLSWGDDDEDEDEDEDEEEDAEEGNATEKEEPQQQPHQPITQDQEPTNDQYIRTLEVKLRDAETRAVTAENQVAMWKEKVAELEALLQKEQTETEVIVSSSMTHEKAQRQEKEDQEEADGDTPNEEVKGVEETQEDREWEKGDGEDWPTWE